jgi:hypothetical protein
MYVHKGAAEFLYGKMTVATYLGGGDAPTNTVFGKVLYPCSDNCHNLMCGPSIMLERGCTPNLKALGHSEENIISFQ